MKTFKVLIASSLFLLGMSSCSKDDDSILNNPVAHEVEGFEDLQIDDNFDWSAARKVTLTIEGLPTVMPVKRIFSVMDAEGTTYHKQLWIMSENGTMEFYIPAYVDRIYFQYGEVGGTAVVGQNGQARFSFIPNIQ
jgi:hypothetical protein